MTNSLAAFGDVALKPSVTLASTLLLRKSALPGFTAFPIGRLYPALRRALSGRLSSAIHLKWLRDQERFRVNLFSWKSADEQEGQATNPCRTKQAAP
jgi:hypothetical protein